MTSRTPVLLSIRTKLLLLSLVILSIPYIGFEYLRELERHLRDALETSLVDAAKASAAPLHDRAKLFSLSTSNPGTALYVHELAHPIQLDGYDHDWGSYVDWSEVYQDEVDKNFGYTLLLGRYQGNVYALVRVSDAQIHYQKPDQPDAIDNDHVSLLLRDSDHEIRPYYFSPSSPGQLRPFSFHTFWNEFGEASQFSEYATNIHAAWQETEAGYTLEIAIPESLAGTSLGIVVRNVGANSSRSLGTAGANTEMSPGALLRSSDEVARIIDRGRHVEGRRTWVLDNQGQVLLSTGSLDKKLEKTHRNIFYSLILPSVATRIKDDLAGTSRLQGEDVIAALEGKTVTRWRNPVDEATVIVSAATPVWVGNEVRGVVVVEETSSGIQMLQRNAMASLFNKTLFIFVIVTGVLLIFATRLSTRIRRLSEQATAAIDEHGRVIGEFKGDRNTDEIGELSRNYAAMLDRLRQYNHYLENLAGRLSHELRTPIAVVQSSLEQLQTDTNKSQQQQYIERASSGMEQLALILTRLSEATRLELSIQSATKQPTEVNELLGNCVKGYRLVHTESVFNLMQADDNISLNIAPDLFVQMLDKLVSNAVDFAAPDTAIEIDLRLNKENCEIEIRNYGSSLPENMDAQLFNSMVSVREKTSTGEPHMGLGLYIVRLIAEYHHGDVRASNLEAGKGVSFTVILPLPSV